MKSNTSTLLLIGVSAVCAADQQGTFSKKRQLHRPLERRTINGVTANRPPSGNQGIDDVPTSTRKSLLRRLALSSDGYEEVKESKPASIYSKLDDSLCISINDDKDIVMRDCTGYDKRQWRTVTVVGDSDDQRTYKFIKWDENDDKCITVDNKVEEGAKLKLGDCKEREYFLWKIEDGNKWRPRADLGLCVTLDDAEQGMKPSLRECDDAKSQQWKHGNSIDKSDDDNKSSDNKDKSSDSDSTAGKGKYKQQNINPRLDQDLCVSVEDKAVVTKNCKGKDNQSWTLTRIDDDKGYYLIQSEDDSDKCIGVSDSKEGRPLRLVQCDEKDRDQLWRLDGKGRLHPRDNDGLCSEISSVQNGQGLYLAECSSKDRQRWELSDDKEEAKKDKSGIMQPVLDDGLCVTRDGREATLEKCKSGKDEQGWFLVTVRDDLGNSNDGDYYAMLVSEDDDDLCMDVRDAEEGEELKLSKCDKGSKYQRWDIDDSRRWRPMDDRSLCVEVTRVREGSGLQLMNCDRTDRQRWNYGRDLDSKSDDARDRNQSKSKSSDDDNDRKDEKSESETKSQTKSETKSQTKSESQSDSGDSEERRRRRKKKQDKAKDKKDRCSEDEVEEYGDDGDNDEGSSGVYDGILHIFFQGGKGKGGGKSGKSSKSSKSGKSGKSSKGEYAHIYYQVPSPVLRPTTRPRPKPKPSCTPPSKPTPDTKESISTDGTDDTDDTKKTDDTKDTDATDMTDGSQKTDGSFPTDPTGDTDGSMDSWDYEKVSSRGSIYSVAERTLCVAVNDKNDVVMRACNNKEEREWALRAIFGDSSDDDDRTYKFITWEKQKNKCIAVRGDVEEGSELYLTKCKKDESFLWKFEEGNRWRPKNDLSLCVEIEQKAEGERPTLEDCRDTNRQRWDVGKGDDGSPPSGGGKPGSQPTRVPTPDPAICSADRSCGRPRRPI